MLRFIRSFKRNRTTRLLFFAVIILAAYLIIKSVFVTNRIGIGADDRPALMIDTIKDVLRVERFKKTNINLYDLRQENKNKFDCIKTKRVVVETTICLHDLTKDVFVSKTLKKDGIWEEDLVTTFMRMLNADPSVNVLDIGAQLGQYCLFAAKFGRKCVAVEPFQDSYIRLHKSALLENTQSLITLVVNGISDQSGEVKRLTQVDNNIGGQSLFEDGSNYANKMNDTLFKNSKYMIEMITLDDLSHVIPDDFKKVVVKIDIQNYEIRAFKKADLLFAKLDVLAIFFEWDDKKKPAIFPNANEIEVFLEFMYSHKYSARNPSNLEKLDRSEWKIWPYDIIWTKDGFVF